MKTGVVYQDGTQKDPVRVSVLVRILKTMALALSAVGSLMILVSLTGLVFVYIPLGVAEVRYGFSKTQLARLTREMTFNEWEKQEKEKEIDFENKYIKIGLFSAGVVVSIFFLYLIISGIIICFGSTEKFVTL